MYCLTIALGKRFKVKKLLGLILTHLAIHATSYFHENTQRIKFPGQQD